MFHGSIVALVTPFRNGAVDEDAFHRLVERHLAEGTHGFVPVGTTGESPTLSHAEHERVVELCVEVVAGRRPVIAGTGSNATEEAISLTRHAKKAGVDAALVVTPYYNRPTQEGLYAHFKAIQDAVDLPIIIYNIPGRSAVEMTVETMARLARLPNIIGVKDSTADIMRPLLTHAACGTEFMERCLGWNPPKQSQTMPVRPMPAMTILSGGCWILAMRCRSRRSRGPIMSRRMVCAKSISPILSGWPAT